MAAVGVAGLRRADREALRQSDSGHRAAAGTDGAVFPGRFAGRHPADDAADLAAPLHLQAVGTIVLEALGWRALPPRRRALGLYAFLYASLHFAVFAGLDYGFDLTEIVRLTGEKPFILLGFSAGTLLLPLAVTSFDYFMRKMGRRWKSLHRLIYLIAPLVIIHYGWAKKGTFFALRGDILQPLLWGALVLLLLVLRIPAVRKRVSRWQQIMVSKRREKSLPQQPD